ncbi:pimeloyl-ACP methyl ester carboxylesterase [Pedobacter cryoconitis]|uniref:Pimeloyl-ACP methyl ester carboxylesterase n=1 Tax=Pedobacter cryoconitis TaxID=188932 RepID=A0A7W8ZJL2_9SPHI|nr:alpha/beta hydrolase [Pedobacter cryoconitis]MBB5635087.1 pimeloyl-ACP methyl ester carboxylesterase [Pedobacter cryoconitis]MBB6271729.1 pimeloyl-ACP methyl ester carboxylesterase [Pedobacter cryoconitis]
MKRIFLTMGLVLSIASIQVFAQKKVAQTDYHQISKTRFIDADGTHYAYRILGDKSGMPLIMLQGSFFNMDEWDPAITNGLAAHFKVILFDNKGVGATNGQTPDNIPAMAKDAESFIKALGYPKVNLLAFSMGGMITQQILADEPQLVNKFILFGTGARGSEGLSGLVDRLTEVGKKKPDEQLLYLLFAPSEQSQEAGKQFLSRIHKRQLNRDIESTNESNGAQITAVLDWSKPIDKAFESLQTITQPALIIDGRYDLLVHDINSYNLFQNLPNAKLSLYPNAGHGSVFQFPDLFLSEAVPFLKAK